jgi:hypothetical protein
MPHSSDTFAAAISGDDETGLFVWFVVQTEKSRNETDTLHQGQRLMLSVSLIRAKNYSCCRFALFGPSGLAIGCV